MAVNLLKYPPICKKKNIYRSEKREKKSIFHSTNIKSYRHTVCLLRYTEKIIIIVNQFLVCAKLFFGSFLNFQKQIEKLKKTYPCVSLLLEIFKIFQCKVKVNIMSDSSIINIRKLFTGGEKLKIARKKFICNFFQQKILFRKKINREKINIQ